MRDLLESVGMGLVSVVSAVVFARGGSTTAAVLFAIAAALFWASPLLVGGIRAYIAVATRNDRRAAAKRGATR